MAAHYTKAEVAEIIEQFLDGTGGDWDWDDFTSFRIADPELDAIRVRCGQLYDEPNYPGRYCGPDGLAEMRRIVEQLRASH
jgi:hypothetical protein